MRHKMIELGKTFKQQINSAESAIDAGTAASAELLASLLRGRVELGFAAQVEAEMIEEVGALVASGLEGRQRAVRVHGRLFEIAQRMGIERMIGDSGDKDAPWITAPQPNSLKLVQSEAA